MKLGRCTGGWMHTSRPVGQSPFLNDLLVLIQAHKLALHISAKQNKLPTRLRLERCWRRPREGSNPLRIRECLVELVGRGLELVRVLEGCRVDYSTLGRGWRST